MIDLVLEELEKVARRGQVRDRGDWKHR